MILANLAIALSYLAAFAGGVLFGWFSLVAYGTIRALRSDGWDESNILNWLRLFAHLFLHPGDFARLFYLTEEGPVQAFEYLGRDEFSENFPRSRP